MPQRFACALSYQSAMTFHSILVQGSIGEQRARVFLQFGTTGWSGSSRVATRAELRKIKIVPGDVIRPLSYRGCSKEARHGPCCLLPSFLQASRTSSLTNSFSSRGLFSTRLLLTQRAQDSLNSAACLCVYESQTVGLTTTSGYTQNDVVKNPVIRVVDEHDANQLWSRSLSSTNPDSGLSIHTIHHHAKIFSHRLEAKERTLMS